MDGSGPPPSSLRSPGFSRSPSIRATPRTSSTAGITCSRADLRERRGNCCGHRSATGSGQTTRTFIPRSVLSRMIESPNAVSGFARDVVEGLTTTGQKRLPPTYFYDPIGSALFEAITVLPEYGLTRADERILTRQAGAIAAALPAPAHVVELGAGSGKKTAPLLQAMQASAVLLSYTSVDVSEAALRHC